MATAAPAGSSPPVRGFRRHPLVRRAARLRRRVRQRSGLQRCSWRGHPFWYPTGSMIGESVADGSGWDTNLFDVLDAISGPRPTVVDVGANIGASLLQMELARPDGRFYCFEPSPRFLAVLRRNVRANGWTNVAVVDRVLSAEAGMVEVFTNASTASVVAREYDGHPFLYARPAPASTFDEMLDDLEALDLVKVDTDGHDLDVLRGATRSVARHAPALYVEFDPRLLAEAGHDGGDLLELVSSWGYDRALAFSNYGTPLAVLPVGADVEDLAATEQYLDLLLVHPDRPAHGAGLEALAHRWLT